MKAALPREWGDTGEVSGGAEEAYRKWREGCGEEASCSCSESYSTQRGANEAKAIPPVGFRGGAAAPWWEGGGFLE
jgi:hypothetical protein